MRKTFSETMLEIGQTLDSMQEDSSPCVELLGFPVDQGDDADISATGMAVSIPVGILEHLVRISCLLWENEYDEHSLGSIPELRLGGTNLCKAEALLHSGEILHSGKDGLVVPAGESGFFDKRGGYDIKVKDGFLPGTKNPYEEDDPEYVCIPRGDFAVMVSSLDIVFQVHERNAGLCELCISCLNYDSLLERARSAAETDDITQSPQP